PDGEPEPGAHRGAQTDPRRPPAGVPLLRIRWAHARGVPPVEGREPGGPRRTRSALEWKGGRPGTCGPIGRIANEEEATTMRDSMQTMSSRVKGRWDASRVNSLDRQNMRLRDEVSHLKTRLEDERTETEDL